MPWYAQKRSPLRATWPTAFPDILYVLKVGGFAGSLCGNGLTCWIFLDCKEEGGAILTGYESSSESSSS